MFKMCPKCGKIWKTKSQFKSSVASGEFELLGIQQCPNHDEKSLYLYTHNECLTTLAIPTVAY